MQDCMNRDQMELASASTSTAVPAKRRGPVAALIAAIIVAAALLFAMPSLAFASSEAEGGPQGAESQEILLSQKGSSTSVSKTPDEPKTPPAYTQQDAYKSTPQSTGSGVDSITGAGDSKATSYTPGDNKSSINDKDSDSDSDVASDSSISGTKDTDDSTLNQGDGTSDLNTDNDSTESSSGAISGSIDENATGNNQSAVPTDSDSKANDVIATPGDKGSADLNAGTTSDNTEEVNQQAPSKLEVQGPPSVDTVSNGISTATDITTQAAVDIQVHFNQSFSKMPSGTSTDNTRPASMIPDITIGNAQDPIFDANGNWVAFGGDDYTVSDLTVDANLNAAHTLDTKAYNIRYGYTLSQWIFIAHNKTTKKWQKIAKDEFAGLPSMNPYKNGTFDEIHAYPYYAEKGPQINIMKAGADFGNFEGYCGAVGAGKQITFPPHSTDVFNGWCVRKAGTDVTTYQEDKVITEDMTCLDAQAVMWGFRGSKAAYDSTKWGAIDIYEATIPDGKITITFDKNAASTVTVKNMPEAGKVESGKNFSIPTNVPTRDNYKFVEWNTKADGTGTKYNTSATITNVTEAITLYAQWLGYTITYNANGGTGGPGTVPATYNSSANKFTHTISSTNPTQNGKTFKGWATSNSATAPTYTAGNTIDPVTANMTLYAVWANNPVIHFDKNTTDSTSGTIPADKTVDSGSNYTIAAGTPQRSGYYFAGWATNAAGTGTKYTSNGAGGTSTTINNVTANITLYAVWNPQISFDGNNNTGGNVPGTTNVAPGSDYNIPNSVPSRTGFTFGGWATNAAGTGTKYSYNGTLPDTQSKLTNVTTTTKLYAVWNPSITFNPNKPSNALSGDSVTGMPSNGSATAGGSYQFPTNTPTLAGYTFGGWKTTAGGASAQYNAGQTITSPTAATTYYAHWTAKPGYTVILKDTFSGSNTTVTTLTVAWDGAVTLTAKPADRASYNWLGYGLKSGNDTVGTGNGTNIVASGTRYNAVRNAAINAGVSGLDGDSTPGTITLYAVWGEKDKIQFSLNPNGGSYNSSTSTYSEAVLPGIEVSIPTDKNNPTREGYNFKGWSENLNGSGTLYKKEDGNTWTLTSNKTLYAAWETAKITIKYNANGGAGTTADDVINYTDSNYTTKRGNTFTKAGHTFGGWYYNAAGTGTSYAGNASVEKSKLTLSKTGSSEDGTLAYTATLYAKWNPITYTVVWNGNGGTAGTGGTGSNVTAETTIVKPTGTNRPGYHFDGWFTEVEGGTEINAGAKVGSVWDPLPASSGNLNAYAHWTELRVQIFFHTADASQATLSFGGTALANGGSLWVGASTGTIFESQTGNAVSSAKNISTGITPVIASGYEWNPNAAAGFPASKWTKGTVNAAGTTALSGVSNVGVLTVPKTNNLYVDGEHFWVTVSPKSYTYTVEYYFQNANDDNYTKATTTDHTKDYGTPALPTPAATYTTGSSLLGYTINAQAGTAAPSTNHAGKITTISRQNTFTGFKFNDSHANNVTNLTISATASNNVLKFYYDRNDYTVNVSYLDAPDGMVYTPASQKIRYGANVALTRPSKLPEGYESFKWQLATGSAGPNGTVLNAGSFAMPAADVTIEGVFTKKTLNVQFLVDPNAVDSHGAPFGSVSAATGAPVTQNLEFGDGVLGVPKANPASGYYFLGWELYTNCPSAGSWQGTGAVKNGLFSSDAILGNDAAVGTPWTIETNSVFIARFALIHVVEYVADINGGFTMVNGSVNSATDEVIQGGSRYSNIQSEDCPLPGFGINYLNQKRTELFEASDVRNNKNPKGPAGYKFVGWSWKDAENVTHESFGTYDTPNGHFKLTDGDAMPTIVDWNYEFHAIWEETQQQLILDPNCASLDGVTATGLPTDPILVNTNASYSLPTVTASTAASGYDFLGWTLDPRGTYNEKTSKVFSSAYTMDAGVQNAAYGSSTGNYGRTLYPVFVAKSTSIEYRVGSDYSAMGSVNTTTEGTSFNMVSGTPKGSTPTANTGYEFEGWYTNPGCTTKVDAAWVDATTKKITPQKGSDGVFASGTYYAKFVPKTYTFTFKIGADAASTHGTFADGTTADKTATITYNTTYGSNIPGTTPAKGYEFTHWLGSDGKTYTNDKLASTKIPASEMTFTAVWGEKSGYKVRYDTGFATTVPNSNATITSNLNSIMPATAKNITRQGYDFGGWYVTKDFDADNKVEAGKIVTFEDGVNAAHITVGDETILTLFAQWTPRNITITYDPQWPNDTTTTIGPKAFSWTASGLLTVDGTDYSTLSASGSSFAGWNTKADGTGTAVTNSTTLESLYQTLYGNSNNTETSIPLFGVWEDLSYKVEFVLEDGTNIKRLTGLKWDSTFNYENYAPADGSATLQGWKYTPAGSSEQIWTGTPSKLPVSTFGGTPADGATFTFTAVLSPNTKYVINYYTVKADGTETAFAHKNTGYVAPGTEIDVTKFNVGGKVHNYPTEFQTNNDATSKINDLKGYEFDNTLGKLSSAVGEATPGDTIEFKIYWKEMEYTIHYLPGQDNHGNNAPSDLGMPSDRPATWTTAVPLPTAADINPAWPGYDFMNWQYRNASGVWTNMTAGATVESLGLADSQKTIDLRAYWSAGDIDLVYSVTVGGTANNAENNYLVSTSSNNRKQTINAVTGTPYTMTATANKDYKFIGWWKDGVKLTEEATITPEKPAGSDKFISAHYEARFEALGAKNYTIEYYFEGLDHVYVKNTSLKDDDTSRSAQEGSNVVLDSSMTPSIAGFTFNKTIEGTVDHIDNIAGGEIMKLYYSRNTNDVWVTPDSGDAPYPVPTIDYSTSPTITDAHTNHAFGEELTLPTMQAVDGWSFIWNVSWAGAAPQQLANGAKFTMPDALVSIAGNWERGKVTVNFITSDASKGTVTPKGGATSTTFTVPFGATLMDSASTGNYASNINATGLGKNTLAGWSYTNAAGTTLTTDDPDSITIDHANFTFAALWAETFSVIYKPGTNSDKSVFGAQVMAVEGIAEADNRNVNEFPLVIGGTEMTMNPPAEKGFSFVGWTWTRDGQTYYKLADGKTYTGAGTPGEMNFLINGNVEFTALWAADSQNLSFKLDGPASVWSGVAAGSGDTYTVTPAPTTGKQVTLLGMGDVQKPGYVLKGWSVWTDADGNGAVSEIEYNSTTPDYYPGAMYIMPANPVTFIPVWGFNDLTITYQVENGSVGLGTVSRPSEKITQDMFEAAGSVAKPNPGYRFDGWYYDAACTDAVEFFYWESVYDDDFNEIGKKLVITKPASGWETLKSNNFFAKFAPDGTTFTIEYWFQRADGTYEKRNQVVCGHVDTGAAVDVMDENNHAHNYLLPMDENKVLTDAAYAGYKFNPDARGSVLAATAVAANGSTKLVLKFDNISYTIDYKQLAADGVTLENVSWSALPSLSAGIKDQHININGVTRDGYRYNGWLITYEDEDGISHTIKTIGVNDAANFDMPAHNVVAIAQWLKLANVTIEFVTNDGTPVANPDDVPTTIERVDVVGQPYSVPNDLITKHRPAGYVFDPTSSVVSLTLADGENIARVVYNLLTEYKINFNANGGQESTTVGGMDIASVIANFQPADLPTKMGYTLGQLDADNALRWNTKADGTGIWLTLDMTYKQLAEALLGAGYDDQALLTNGMTLYANWIEKDTFKVIFDLNNDKKVNTDLKKPVPDYRNPVTPATMEGVRWTQDGFNIFSDEELDAAPNGYEFAGWNTARDGSGLTITNPTEYLEMSNAINANEEQESITLYAMWKELIVEIIYDVNDDNGGTIDRTIDRVSAVTGEHVDNLSSPGERLHSVATAKPGYHFVRWEYMPLTRTIGIDENETDTKRDDHSEFLVVEPDENGRLVAARYVAIFEKNPEAVIEYDLNGGNYFVNGNEAEMPSTTLSHGLTTDLHKGTGVKLPHYTLKGWNTAADGTGTTYKLGQKVTMPEEGMTLYAMWDVKKYSVHVADRGDDVADVKGFNTQVEYGTPVDPALFESVTQTPKNGSTFKGWKYTMTDAETGEVYEGTVWDLSELPEIVGPIEVEAEYDTPVVEELPEVEVPEEDVVTEGTVLPKTGDDGLLAIIAIILAALALIVLGIRFLVAFFARRRNSSDPDNDPHGKGFGPAAVNNFECKAARTPQAAFAFVQGAGNADPLKSINNRLRNGRFACGATMDVATACGAQTTSSGLFLSGTLYTRGSHGAHKVECCDTRSVRIGIVAVIAACVLTFAVAFAPGIALASTGDPGDDAGTTTSIQTRSNHSNADPAIHQTGSLSVKSTGSSSTTSSKRTSSSTATVPSSKTASATTKSANSTPRASADSSAASADSSSTGETRASTLKASDYELKRLTLQNKLTHKNNSYKAATNGVQNVVSSTASTSKQKVATATLAARSAGTSTAVIVSRAETTQSAASAIATDIITSDASALSTADASTNAASLSYSASGNGATTLNASLRGNIAPLRDPVGAITPLNSTNRKFSTLLTINHAAIVPARGTSNAADSDSEESSDPGVVKITYTAGEGGNVSEKQDLICAITGTLPDADGMPTDKELIGTIATPALGYHFVGWTVEGCSTCVPDELCCDQAKLDAKTVKGFSYSKDASSYTALKFTSVFERNTYAFDYDLTGGGAEGSATMAKGPDATTFGNDDVMKSAAQPTREGYKFLCWNTSADGMGAPVRDGETLSTSTLRSLVRSSIGRESDADGSTIKLYARWTPTVASYAVDSTTSDPEPIAPDEPVTPVRPATPSTPASPSATPSTAPASPAQATPARVHAQVQTAALPVAARASESEANTEAEESIDPSALIADAQNALSLPPALEVLPAAAEGFATISAEALSGLQEGGETVGMSSADATRAAATVAAAAGAIAIIFGVAGAASQIAARRRVNRSPKVFDQCK